MKRFALKRITALVLALVMTLSLMPMSAWAMEGTQNQLPEFTCSSKAFGVNGMFVFTGRDENDVLSYNGTITHRGDQTGQYFTIPCTDENAPEKLYLAAFPGNTLTVGNEELTDAVGTWTSTFDNGSGGTFNETLNVYELPVPIQTDLMITTTVILSSVYHDDNDTPDDPSDDIHERSEAFHFIFDFAPDLSYSGKPFGFSNVFFFTGKDKDNALSYNGTISHRGDQSGDYVTVPCATNAPEKLYLAVFPGETLTVGDKELTTLVGKWTSTFQGNDGNFEETLNVYELAVPTSSDDLTTTKTVTRSWSWYDKDTGKLVTESRSFNLVFDFTPALTYSGHPFGLNGVFIFTGKDGNALSYNGNILHRGDESGEYVLVPCASNAPEKLYLATFPGSAMRVGNEVLTKSVGKWTSTFEGDDGDFEETLDVYELDVPTASEYLAATTTVTRSWTWHEGEEEKSDSSSFSLTFDFTLEPGIGNGGDDDIGPAGPFSAKGIDIYTGMEEGELFYNESISWDCEGNVIVPNDMFGEKLFLVTNDNLTVTGSGVAIAKRTEDPTKWGDRNIYELTVTKQNTTISTIIGGIGEGKTETLAVKFEPSFVPVGSAYGYDVGEMIAFTKQDANGLTYSGGVGQYEDQYGKFVTIDCANAASKTVYLAVNTEGMVTVLQNSAPTVVTPQGFYTSGNENYYIYALTAQKPEEGNKAEHPVVIDYSDNRHSEYYFSFYFDTQSSGGSGFGSDPFTEVDNADAIAFFSEYFDYDTYTDTDSNLVVVNFWLKAEQRAPNGGHLTEESLAFAEAMMEAYDDLSNKAKKSLDKLCIDPSGEVEFGKEMQYRYADPQMADPTGTMAADKLSAAAKQFLKDAGLTLSDDGELAIDGATIVVADGGDRFFINYNETDTAKGLAGMIAAGEALTAYFGWDFDGNLAPLRDRGDAGRAIYNELNQLKITVNGEEMWFQSAMDYFYRVYAEMRFSGYYEEYLFHAAGYKAPVLNKDFFIRVPDGLEYGVDYSYEYTTESTDPVKNGLLTIHVKAGEKAHWQQAFENTDKMSLNAGILFSVDFNKPTGANRFTSLCGQGTDGLWRPYLDNSGNYPTQLYESGRDIGWDQNTVGNGRLMAAINQMGNIVTVTPSDAYQADHMLVVWYKGGEGDNKMTEVGPRFMLRFRVVVDDEFSYEFNVATEQAKVESVDVDFDNWAVVKNGPGEVIVRPVSGTIRETLNTNMSGNRHEFGTFTVAPPADGYVLDWDESNRLTQDGELRDGRSGSSTDEVTLKLYAHDMNGGTYKVVFYSFVWKKTGAPDIIQELTVRVTEKQSYFADIGGGTAQPVNYDDDNDSALPEGMTANYDEALGFVEINFEQMPSLEDVKDLYNHKGIWMAPMEGATHFRWTGGDGNQDLANIDLTEANTLTNGLRDAEIKPLYRGSEYSPEAQWELIFGYAPIEKLDVGGLSIYYVATQNYRYQVAEWLKQVGENEYISIGYSYIYGRSGPLVQTETTASISEGELPNGEVTQPIIIGEGMNLVANRYIQEGGGGKHWYLRLSVDEESNLDKVNGNWVYLPYDYVGLTRSEAEALKQAGQTPVIYHYTQGEGMPPEVIVGEYAPQGVKFNVKSFSPFVVDVSAEEGNTGGNAGGYPGGYHPIVTPTTPVEKPTETKPTTPAQPTTPPAEDVTPEPEDTTPVVPEAPATHDAPAVDNAPADDATPSDSGNSVGLWIGVALAVLVVAIIVVVILIKRKKA